MQKTIEMSETQPNEPPRSTWTVGGDWIATSLLHDRLVDSWHSYRVCVRHACENNVENQTLRGNGEIVTTHTHHALVGNCRECMRVGFVGMRCTCNTGGIPRYIVMLNGQQLRCDDPTTQEPPKPLNICAFYHSITVPSDDDDDLEHYMSNNGYVIERGFVSGWDKDFANPTQPWTLELTETDEFFNEHQERITIQSTMEEIFFETEQPIMLEYLIGSLAGLSWENVLRCARDAVHAHFKKQGITGGTYKTAWWLRLQARGLPIAVDPNSNIDLRAIPSPNNPL